MTGVGEMGPPHNNQRVDHAAREHFLRILNWSPAESDAYLRKHCPEQDIRRRVESLLAAHRQEEALRVPIFDHLRDADAPPLDATLHDRYRINGILGIGGMSVVYRAIDMTLEREVAVKMLRAEVSALAEDRAQFQQEMRLVARLNHPAIVPVFDSGIHDDRPFMVMELIRGQTLGDYLRRRFHSAQPHSTSEFRDIASIFARIADGVQHAHDHGVIHRDIKPSNILIDERAEPRLADFGVAHDDHRISDDDASAWAGTFRYMSPEQAQRASTTLDGRSDIFSLGIVLYEALTGTPPYTGDDPEDVLQQAIAGAIPPARTINARVPRDLSVICQTSTESSLPDRYQAAAQFGGDLRAFLQGEPILARPMAGHRRLVHWMRQRSTAAFTSAIALLTLTITLIIVSAQLNAAARACRLTLTSSPSNAEVILQTFDTASDRILSERALGRTPLRNVALDLGRHRLTVFVDEQQFAEIDLRNLEERTQHTLEVKLRTTSEAQRNMVRISGGPYEVGTDGLTRPFQRLHSVTVPEFFLDAREISNAEYKAFLDVHDDATPPLFWPREFEDSFWDRPVVGLTMDEMERYARWVGKRLPTATEWEIAWAGHARHRFPWGDALPNAWPDVADADRRMAKAPDPDLNHEHYMKYVAPTDSFPELASSNGLHHMTGNVSEMTSSWELESSRFVVVRGGNWLDPPEGLDLRDARLLDGRPVSFFIGFRLARSAEPATVSH